MTHLFEISLEQNKCEAQRKKLSNSFEQSTTNLQISNVCCNCKTLISEKCDGWQSKHYFIVIDIKTIHIND